jgi:hypothetical protein
VWAADGDWMFPADPAPSPDSLIPFKRPG